MMSQPHSAVFQHICRSSTLAGWGELYGRTGYNYIFSGGLYTHRHSHMLTHTCSHKLTHTLTPSLVKSHIRSWFLFFKFLSVLTGRRLHVKHQSHSKEYGNTQISCVLSYPEMFLSRWNNISCDQNIEYQLLMQTEGREGSPHI